MSKKNIMVIVGVLMVLGGIGSLNKNQTEEVKDDIKPAVTIKKEDTKKEEVKKVDREDEVKAIIKDFIDKNFLMFDRGYGEGRDIEFIQKDKDWAKGERWKVWIKGNKEGREWVFYLEGNEIDGIKYIGENKVEDIYKR